MQKFAKSHAFLVSVCSTAAHFACSLNDVPINDIGNCYNQLIVYKFHMQRQCFFKEQQSNTNSLGD